MGGVKMKLEYFEYLLEIARRKNMRVSSEYLHMTPQALSICIKNMEEEVGFAILDRKPKGVEFTAHGEKLLACAERVLQDYYGTLQDIRQETKQTVEQKDLFVYCTPIINVLLNSWMETYLTDYPHASINVINSVPKRIMDQVTAAADLNVIGLMMDFQPSVLALSEYLSDSFILQRCFTDELTLAVAKNSIWAKKGALAIEDLAGQTFIHCTEEEAKDMAMGAMFAPVEGSVKHIQCNSLHLWGKMIGNNLGIGPIIRRALQQVLRDGVIDHTKVVGVPINGRPTLSCFCIYPKAAPDYVKKIAAEISNL